MNGKTTMYLLSPMKSLAVSNTDAPRLMADHMQQTSTIHIIVRTTKKMKIPKATW